MESLEECYQRLSQDRKSWCYYDDTALSIVNKWKNSECAYDFIKQYFHFGNKTGVFEHRRLINNRNIIKERTQHIISTFLLGIEISKYMGINLHCRDDYDMNFKYYWFVTCLYHDIGYVFEKNSEEVDLDIIKDKGIDGFIKRNNLHKIPTTAFKTYSKEEVDLYYKWRASNQIVDHGITGGILLYDGLKKEFNNAWENREDTNQKKDSFYYIANGRRLHLSKRHFSAYKKAVDAVVAHNIWIEEMVKIVNDSEISMHGGQGRYKKIDISNNLGFILALADTIEPIKRDEEYLRKIYIGKVDNLTDQINSIRDDTKGFCLKIEKTEDTIFSEICNSIRSLNQWVDVKITENEDNKSLLFCINV